MKKFALLLAPVVFALGCGGVDCLVTPSDPSCKTDCTAGVTPYQVKTGVYKTGSVPSVNETCGLGLTAASLQTDRELANDAQGNITVYSLDLTENRFGHRPRPMQPGHVDLQRHRELGWL